MHFSLNRRKMPALGALEIQVLQHLWSAAAPLDARAVLDKLSARAITLSTVQATLERLTRKCLLARTKLGRAYLYAPQVTREGLIGSLIRDVADRLAAGELEPVISGFVDFVGDADPELLGHLETSAKRRRGRSL